MQLIQAIILGLTQGLTEFIPVSSSGHLIIVGHILNFQYSGLAFDTALDIGTLAALYLFFWKDFWNMALAVVRNQAGEDRRLAWLIILGTVPAVVLGLIFEHKIDAVFHTGPHATTYVAINLIWVAIVMLVVDQLSSAKRNIATLTSKDSIITGLAQAVALIPGVSRSGSTITAGRWLGFDRVSATRFSFMLSAPVITAATLKEVLKSSTLHEMGSVPMIYILGILAAFASGYWAIKFLIGYVGKHGLSVFAYYRIAVGLLILALGIR